MNDLTFAFRHILVKQRWRKARKRGRTLRLRIGNISDFLVSLNQADIRYLALRWFDEVPLTADTERQYDKDIDLLLDYAHLENFVRHAARFPGKIKCDVYTQTGKRGTGYKKMPYYPPVLAEELLQHRQLYQGRFYVPQPEWHFYSLAYHCVYHKGLKAGIPSGTELPSDSHPKRPYGERLAALGRSLDIPLKTPYSLLQLHDFLESKGWSMPYDLLVRWPQQHQWMARLAAHERQKSKPCSRHMDNIIVFMLRSDASGDDIERRALELLEGRFTVIRVERLDPEARKRVTRSVRGGNWLEHRNAELVEPYLAVIVHDPNPEPMDTNDPLRNKFPLVRNRNVFYKNEIREVLNKEFPAAQRRVAVHASDNPSESIFDIKAIYGERYSRICHEIDAESGALGHG